MISRAWFQAPCGGRHDTRRREGIIFIDEIDKIAKKEETLRAGCSGESVQQGCFVFWRGRGGGSVEPTAKRHGSLSTINTETFCLSAAEPFRIEDIISELKKQTPSFQCELKDNMTRRRISLAHDIEDLKSRDDSGISRKTPGIYSEGLTGNDDQDPQGAKERYFEAVSEASRAGRGKAGI